MQTAQNGNTPVAATTPVVAQPMQPDYNQGGRAPSASAGRLGDLLGVFNPPAQITTDGKAFIERLKAAFVENNVVVTVAPVTDVSNTLDLIQVSNADGHYFLLAFTERRSTTGNLSATVSPTVFMEDSTKRLNNEGGKLINWLVITKEDYSRASEFALAMNRSFKAHLASNVNIEVFTQANLVVSTNLNQVRDVIASLNPHKVQPRVDFGFVVYMQEAAPKDNFGLGREQSQPTLRPILAVGAYTRFVSERNQMGSFGSGELKIIPIVSISAIESPLPLKGLISIAIPIGIEVFINRHGWLAPYRNYGKDRPNLGAFFKDGEGRPLFVENDTDLNAALNSRFTKPHLAIEVTDGRSRIPGLEKISRDARTAINDLCQFLGNTATYTGAEGLVRKQLREFQGLVAGGTMDSREIDYLSLVARSPSIAAQAEGLTFLPVNPVTRGEKILELMGDYVAQYESQICVLSVEAVNSLGSLVMNRLNLRFDTENRIDNDVSLLSAGASYSVQAPGSGGYYQGGQQSTGLFNHGYRG